MYPLIECTEREARLKQITVADTIRHTQSAEMTVYRPSLTFMILRVVIRESRQQEDKAVEIVVQISQFHPKLDSKCLLSLFAESRIFRMYSKVNVTTILSVNQQFRGNRQEVFGTLGRSEVLFYLISLPDDAVGFAIRQLFATFLQFGNRFFQIGNLLIQHCFAGYRIIVFQFSIGSSIPQ